MAKILPLDKLIGKPVIVHKDGKRREVGTITQASYHNDHIRIEAGITDEVLGKLLQKNAREGLSIGGNDG